MVEIKGSTIRDAVAAYQEHLADELLRVLARLDPSTRELFQDRIAPNAWFPLDALVCYLEAQLVESGAPAEMLIARTEVVTERQLNGIDRIFARLLSPASVVGRIAAINATYFRGVEVERRSSSDHGAVLLYVGFEPRHELMGYIIIGFYRKTLEVCGARSVRADWTTPISAGAGYAELTIGWEDA